MKRAIIKKVSKGRNKGQFRFVLKASNGEIVAQSHPETYERLQSCLDTLNNNFPDFDIIKQN